MIISNFLSSHDRVAGFHCYYSNTRKYRISSVCLLVCFFAIVRCAPSTSSSFSSHTTVSFIHHVASRRQQLNPTGRTRTTKNYNNELNSVVPHRIGWGRRLPLQRQSCNRSKTKRSSTKILLSPNEYTILVANTATAVQHQSVHLPNLLEAYGSLLQQYPITTKCMTASILGCIGDAIAQYGAFYQKQKQTNEDEQQKQENSPIHNPTQQQQQGLAEGDDEIQLQEPKVEFEYDLRRGSAFFLFGALYTGAFQHYWFEYLSDHVSSWGQEIGIWDQSAKAGKFSTALMAIADGTRQHEWFTCFDVKLHMELPPPPLAIAAGKVMVNQFFMVPALYMPLFFAMTGYVAGLDAKQSADRCRSLYIPLLVRNYVFWLPVQFMQFLFIPVQWQIPVQAVASLIWTIILSSIGVSNNSSSSTVVTTTTATTTSDTEEALPLPETAMVATGVAINGQQLSNTFMDANTEDVELRDLQNEQSAQTAESNAAVDSLALLDDVRVEDVIPEPILDTANRILMDNKVGAAGGGFAIGLLTAAADEAFVGSVVGAMLGGEAQLGVAVMSAVGAGVGILAANAASAVADNIGYQMPSPESFNNNTETIMDPTLDNNMTANQDPSDRYSVEINLLSDKVALKQYPDDRDDTEIIPILSNGNIEPILSIGDLALISSEDDASNPELFLDKLKNINFSEPATNGQYEQQTLPSMSKQAKYMTIDNSMHTVEAEEANSKVADSSNGILFVESNRNGQVKIGKHHDDSFSANSTVYFDHPPQNDHSSILCEHNETNAHDVLCFNNCENIGPFDDKLLSTTRTHIETISRSSIDNEAEGVTKQQAIQNHGQLDKMESNR